MTEPLGDRRNLVKSTGLYQPGFQTPAREVFPGGEPLGKPLPVAIGFQFDDPSHPQAKRVDFKG